jgi:tRNA threonylcarbamoyladenosine biosynthesis protein TsaB
VAAAPPSGGRVVAVLDAQRKEVYVGEYESQAGESGGARPPELIEEKLLPMEAFIAGFQQRISSPALCTPDPAIGRVLREAGLAVEIVARPGAPDIARIALARFLQGRTVLPEALDANYLRRSDAEIFAMPKSEKPD